MYHYSSNHYQSALLSLIIPPSYFLWHSVKNYISVTAPTLLLLFSTPCPSIPTLSKQKSAGKEQIFTLTKLEEGKQTHRTECCQVTRQVSDDIVRCSDHVEDITISTADVTNRFKFFETYKAPEKERKAFRITPPREGQVKVNPPLQHRCVLCQSLASGLAVNTSCSGAVMWRAVPWLDDWH